MWVKAIERREADPEAAITLARSLIESVCKHILNEAGRIQGNPDQLYRQTHGVDESCPKSTSEQPFRQLLGACNPIVGSLYAIRTDLETHTPKRFRYNSSPRHAELAVNVAGSFGGLPSEDQSRGDSRAETRAETQRFSEDIGLSVVVIRIPKRSFVIGSHGLTLLDHDYGRFLALTVGCPSLMTSQLAQPLSRTGNS